MTGILNKKDQENGFVYYGVRISAPATRAFLLIGITKLEHFTKYSEKELLQLHGVGPKAIRILREELKNKELSFKKEK